MEGNDMFIDDALEQDAGLSLESDANDFNVQEMAEDVPQFPEMMEEVVLESDGNDCDAAVLDCEVCEEFMLFAADGTLLSHTVGEAVSLDEPQPIQFDELGMDEAPILADDANESSEYAFLGNDDMQAMSITPFSNTLNVSPMTFNNVSAAGGTTQNINVTSNISWSVISHATAWLIPSISSGSGNRTFTVRIVASGSTVARTGSVSVSGGGIIRSIQFHQLGTTGGGGGGGANLTVSHAGWNSIPSGGWTSPSITVTSNITWNLSRSHTWLTPSLGLGNWTGTRTLTVTVGQNTGAARSGNVTVSGSNITRNISFAQLAGTPASNLTVSHAGWNSIPSGGWTSPTITVTSNITWNLSRSHTWLTPSLGLGNWTGTRTLTVTVGQNTGAARSGNVTASGGGITRNISFAQLAGAPANPPPAPTNLRLNGSAGTTSIPLTWNASAGATSYDVFRSGTLLGNVGGTSANVTGLAPGTSHSFTVRARNAHGSSGNSNTLTASTLPGQGGGGVSPQGYIWPVAAGRPTVNANNAWIANHRAIDIIPVSNPNFPSWTALPETVHTPAGRNASATGAPVVAARAGVISMRFLFENHHTAGNGFYIAHGGGYFTRYLHLHHTDFRNIAAGTSVTRGQILGLTGQTGTTVNSNGHLHFEVIRVNGRSGATAAQDSQLFRNRWLGGMHQETGYDQDIHGNWHSFRRFDPRTFLLPV